MITCVVLAAGESRRFPGNKLLFEIKPGVTIIEILLKSILASKVDRTIVVLGHEAELVIKKIKHFDSNLLHSIVNPNYINGGMSSSIRQGVKHALDSHAIIITPADIPLIPPKVFDQLIDYYFNHSPRVIIPTFQDQKGHPILVSSELFQQVLNISEEKRGMKEIVQNYWDDIIFLPTDSREILQDVDKYEDMILLKSNLEDRI
ncbi:MAG: nucleotidyltransferase family protein [Candidatus Heimdallarchaeota archaeon]|nr:MAG: nucleotidyltransferase family protein [Candidatus Heimdallarchaeota archaeon]